MSIASQLTFIQNFVRNSKDVFLPVHFHRPCIYCFDPPRYQRGGEEVGEGGEICFEKYIQVYFHSSHYLGWKGWQTTKHCSPIWNLDSLLMETTGTGNYTFARIRACGPNPAELNLPERWWMFLVWTSKFFFNIIIWMVILNPTHSWVHNALFALKTGLALACLL